MGQVLLPAQPPDVGLTSSPFSARQQQQLEAAGLQEVLRLVQLGLLMLLLQRRKAAAPGRKSFMLQKAPPASSGEGFENRAETAAKGRCPLNATEN